jgi:hypothetical protein
LQSSTQKISSNMTASKGKTCIALRQRDFIPKLPGVMDRK